MAEISWELMERQVAACQMCDLCQEIHHKVPGQGDHHSPLMFIGKDRGRWRMSRGWPLWVRRGSC